MRGLANWLVLNPNIIPSFRIGVSTISNQCPKQGTTKADYPNLGRDQGVHQKWCRGESEE